MPSLRRLGYFIMLFVLSSYCIAIALVKFVRPNIVDIREDVPLSIEQTYESKLDIL